MEVGLALGSNIGDRLDHLIQVKKEILAIAGVEFIAQSPVYETEPVGVPDEFANLVFLNSILIIETCNSIHRLIGLFQSIEREMGRSPDAVRNMPRPIDIDIIYADQVRAKAEHVTIPHPRWSKRRFVVQPLSDVRPDLHIPGQSGTVSDVLSGLADKSKVAVFADEW